MRTFELHRDEDEGGISGTGLVAQGIEFDDLTVALRWLTARASTAVYGDMATFEAVHGHAGKTRIIYTGDPYRRGMTDCYQDRSENAPFNSVGGLEMRGELRKPKWISPREWDLYRDGYQAAAKLMWDDDWRTCTFGWAQAVAIGSGGVKL